jgi:hypothetical protein
MDRVCFVVNKRHDDKSVPRLVERIRDPIVCKSVGWKDRVAERGIRTPGAGFPAHGISSAAAVGSTTLGACDKTTCFIVFFASPGPSEFCQNTICQKPVKNRSAGWADPASFCQTLRLLIRHAPETLAAWRQVP